MEDVDRIFGAMKAGWCQVSFDEGEVDVRGKPGDHGQFTRKLLLTGIYNFVDDGVGSVAPPS